MPKSLFFCSSKQKPGLFLITMSEYRIGWEYHLLLWLFFLFRFSTLCYLWCCYNFVLPLILPFISSLSPFSAFTDLRHFSPFTHSLSSFYFPSLSLISWPHPPCPEPFLEFFVFFKSFCLFQVLKL